MGGGQRWILRLLWVGFGFFFLQYIILFVTKMKKYLCLCSSNAILWGFFVPVTGFFYMIFIFSLKYWDLNRLYRLQNYAYLSYLFVLWTNVFIKKHHTWKYQQWQSLGLDWQVWKDLKRSFILSPHLLHNYPFLCGFLLFPFCPNYFLKELSIFCF